VQVPAIPVQTFAARKPNPYTPETVRWENTEISFRFRTLLAVDREYRAAGIWIACIG
jgi:hypothetical protein